MRFSTILLLATAVSAVRITQKTAVKVEEPTEAEIKEFIKKNPKKALKMAVKKVFEECDTGKDGTLSKDEIITCLESIPKDAVKEIPEDLKKDVETAVGELDKDDKVTPEMMGKAIKGAYEKYAE